MKPYLYSPPARRGFLSSWAFQIVAVFSILATLALATLLDEASAHRVSEAREAVQLARTSIAESEARLGDVALAAWKQGQRELIDARPGSHQARELERACQARGLVAQGARP